MFHIFDSQEKRRKYGGSAFTEFQFCRLPMGTPIEKTVEVESINHWQNDSLYVYFEDDFFAEYGQIFDCGTYCNLKTGTVDLYGINYYSLALIDGLIDRINEKKPADHEVLTEWLNRAKQHNGFYILGI